MRNLFISFCSFSLFLKLSVLSGVLISVSGCSATLALPKKPTSIAIVEAPRTTTAAVVGTFVPQFGYHFTKASDWLFSASQDMVVPAGGAPNYNQQSMNIAKQTAPGPAGVVGGAVAGAVLQSFAGDTQLRAQKFHEKVLEQFPDLNLGNELLGSIVDELNARGVKTTIISNPFAEKSRVIFATNSDALDSFPVETIDVEGVDVEYIVQISPIAIYRAGGQLNSYQPFSSIAFIVFDGKTRKYVGHNLFYDITIFSDHSYSTYTGLESDIKNAIPGLRKSLLSLAPKVVAQLTANQH